MGRHQPARLVIEEQPRALRLRQRRAVHLHHVVGGDVERGRIDDTAVDGDAPLLDPFLGVAARGKAGARHQFRNALAALFRRGRRWRLAFVVGPALAIGAAAAEGRTPGENLAVVLVVAPWPIRKTIAPLLAARMVLPRLAASSARRAVAILARTAELRTIAALLARPIELAGTVARRTRLPRTGIARPPRLVGAALRAVAEILARAGLPEAFAARLGGALVAEPRIAGFAVREPSRRAGAAAIAMGGAVVPLCEGRAVAARGAIAGGVSAFAASLARCVGSLFTAAVTRPEILPRAAIGPVAATIRPGVAAGRPRVPLAGVGRLTRRFARRFAERPAACGPAGRGSPFAIR